MKAKRLLLLTDVEGVLDETGELLQELTVDEARALIRDGTGLRRYDPENRGLHRGGGSRRRGRGRHHQRQGQALGA